MIDRHLNNALIHKSDPSLAHLHHIMIISNDNDFQGLGVNECVMCVWVEWVVWQPEGRWFDPRLLLAECPGVPERDTSP